MLVIGSIDIQKENKDLNGVRKIGRILGRVNGAKLKIERTILERMDQDRLIWA